jgi:serine/threonine-protein kinase RsbW
VSGGHHWDMSVPATMRATTETVLLPAQPRSVSQARHHLVTSLDRRGVPSALVADAELVVSELMANAVLHARPLDGDTVRVIWRVRHESPPSGIPVEVEIAVVDGGAPWFPRVEDPPADVDNGRGMGIVSTLTAEWGVEGAGSSHQLVWAVLREE